MADVGNIAVHDPDPIYRARALWVWHAIEGDAVAMAALTPGGQPGGAAAPRTGRPHSGPRLPRERPRRIPEARGQASRRPRSNISISCSHWPTTPTPACAAS